MLQGLEKKYQNQGLTLLAASIDSEETRKKIPAFLEKNHLDCRVLLAGEPPVEGFGFEAASSLFLVDRNGMLAGYPVDFYFRFEKELGRRLPDLLAGHPAPGAIAWALGTHPEGFSELWHQPVPDLVTSLAVAPSGPGRSAEIGVLDQAHHLQRFSAAGVRRGDVELENKDSYRLMGADLDSDGTNEWIVLGENFFEVLDQEGRRYWQQYSPRPLEVGGIADLDGDGRNEIVYREGDRITALRSLQSPLWTTEQLHNVSLLHLDGRGGIWAQAGSSLWRLDRRGRTLGAPTVALASAEFRGEIRAGNSDRLHAFGQLANREMDLDHDLDGDGKPDIMVKSSGGIEVYSSAGSVLLELFLPTEDGNPRAALVDLDGRPGDELVVFVPQYGLLALGMKRTSGAVAETSAGAGL